MANVLIEESTLTAIGNAIRAKTGGTAGILPANMAAEISGITGGGGGSNLVRYVTFLAEDGSELFKMPVLVGDTCKDPVSHGDISTPTKASTNTTNYTHSGWTSAVGGDADSNILKNITADKTVYVAFATSIRYYTVTFYDGSTVLKTVQATYGANVSDYKPEKSGYTFNKWEPSPTNVTADMDCYAVWDEGITFAKSSWADIAAVSEAGQARQYFKAGDTRTITWNDTTVTLAIAGFDHDDLADGSGKAGISIIFKTIHDTCKSKWQYDSYTKCNYNDSKLRGYMGSTVLNGFPSDLKAVMKQIKKPCDSSWLTSDMTISDVSGKVFPISLKEAGIESPDATLINNLGEPYEYCNMPPSSQIVTRTLKHVSGQTRVTLVNITTSGNVFYDTSGDVLERYIKPVFCI